MLLAARETYAADISITDLPVADLRQNSSLHRILKQNQDTRVFLLGEIHTRYDHHLVQLEVLKYLYQTKQKVALGVEWFQQPFQQYLDDYIAGKITEAEMLYHTDYFTRWGYDYRLYRPIIQYAREKQIPIVALNASTELTSALAKSGFDQLSADLRKQLPDSYDFSDQEYMQRLRNIYTLHPDQSRLFASFLLVQLTWDESMAALAAEYLLQHPDSNMLILAGSGHISYGSGIPQRIKRRLKTKQLTLLINDDSLSMSPDMADVLVLSSYQTLQPAGLLGVFLNKSEGRVAIQGFVQDSALKDASIAKGSIIVGINEKTVNTFTDLKLALIDKSPGDTVELHYLDKGDERKSKQIKLR